MPRKGSKKKPSVQKSPEEDWAAIYGQPAEPRTVESYEEEWSHWNIQPDEPEELSEPEPPPPSAPPSESEDPFFDSPVRLRKKRMSSSPYRQATEDLLESQKRWSRPPIVVEDPGTRQTLMIGMIFFLIIAMLLFVGVIYQATEKTVLRVIRPNHMPTFDKKLMDLKQQFPTQPAHNWAIVRGAFAEVLNNSDYPYGPAILIILAPKKEQNLATCFSGRLASSLAKSFHPAERPIVLNGAKLRNSRDAVAAKHTIDNAVKDKDNFVMQFNSLEQIDSYTASIFHSLCDYYNSPFKERAVFIFTVHTTEEVEGRSRKDYDEMADRVLNDAWEELDINKRSALLARLTGNTILLRKEPRRVC